MSAPKIYTKEFVTKELSSILQDILRDKKVVVLGEVMEKRSYPRQCFSEWADEYGEDKAISDTIRKIKNILEDRVASGSLKKKLHPIAAIFNLKNNYGWKDKSEVDNNSNIRITGYEKLTDEELDNAINEYHRKNGGAKADPGKAEENKSQSA